MHTQSPRLTVRIDFALLLLSCFALILKLFLKLVDFVLKLLPKLVHIILSLGSCCCASGLATCIISCFVMTAISVELVMLSLIN